MKKNTFLIFFLLFISNISFSQTIYENFDDESAANATTNYTTSSGLIVSSEDGTNYFSGSFTVDGHLYSAFIYATQKVNGVIKLSAPVGKVFNGFSGDFYYGSGVSEDHGTITMYYKGVQVGTPVNVNASKYHRFSTTETFDELRAASIDNGHFYIDDVEFSASNIGPVFENSTPSTASITGTGFTLNTDINEGGTIYYVVVADGAATPTSAEVKAGTGSSGATAAASGSATVSTGDFTHAFSITGLSSATAYDVYVVAQDDESEPNVQTSASKVDVTTNAAPTFTSTALTSVDEGETYKYFIQTNDTDGDEVTVTAPTKPSWLTLTAVDLTTIGEGTAGGVEGDKATAQFSSPTGIVVDGAGNMYVSQNGSNQHKIRKITPDGVVSTLAGSGTSGSADGTGSGASFANAFGLFIDASDNIYVADNANIRKITSAGVVTTIGTTSQPIDVVADSDGKIYSIEYNSGVINRFPAAGGSPTTFATVNGGGQIGGMVIDASNNIYVGTRGVEIGTGKIYKVTPGGVVTEEVTGLNLLGGLAMDTGGNFYYTTWGNEVHKVTPGGTVSTVMTGLNGSWEVAVDASGNIYAPSRNANQIKTTLKGYKLSGDATDKVGDHSVTLTANDGNSGTVNQSFTVTVNDVTPPVFENSTPSAASITGTGFTLNTDIDEAGFIYYVVVPDAATPPTAAEVKAGTASGGASTISSDFAAANSGDFTHAFSITGLSPATAYDVYVVAEDDESTPNVQASPAKIDVSTANTPPSFTSTAVTTVKVGSAYSYYISATDADGHALTYTAPTVPSWLTFDAAGVQTFAGGSNGYADGTGTAARFSSPAGVASANSGNIYVADWNNHLIRKITPEGTVTTLAGSQGAANYADGTGSEARFNTPAGIVVDASENVYVTEFGGHRIRKITPEGVVTTIAGSGVAGFADDTGTAAQFNGPLGIAIDQTGNLYVGDFNNHRIRKITPAGVVSTLAGSGAAGFANDTGAAAQFNGPSGVTVDASGNVYMAEFYGHRIRKITPEGVVTTLAGNGASGHADGTGTTAQFNSPFGIALDQSGNVFVGGNSFRVRKISPAGVVSTVVGNGISSYTDGTLSEARVGQIWGIAIDDQGKIFLGGNTNHAIRTVSTSTRLYGTPTVDNIGTHNVVLEVSDGNGGTVQQSFTVEVLENTPPAFTSATTASFVENGTGTAYTAVATDANSVSYSFGPGNDEALFNINSSTGAITFKTAPDFETPGDSDDNNTYVINVIATDEAENASNQNVTITVTDADEVSPVFTSATSTNFAENGTGTAYTTVATDANTVTYSLGSGNDEALFDMVSSSGVVTFESAPDFENPTDSDKNNAYVINVIATDEAGNASNQNVTITVTDVDDTAPVFTSGTSVGFAENGTGTAYTAVATDANTVTYSLGTGNDEALFDIVAGTGVVTFKSVPDFETPGDTDNNNTYVINVIASNEANNASDQKVTITVTDVDDTAPIFTSGTSVGFAENGTGTAYTAVATDANTVTYSLGTGNDEALFDIVAGTGAVTFKSAPDFETPGDTDNNNTYVINVIATDEANNTSIQEVTITVTDVDDTVLGIAPGRLNGLSIYPNPVTDEAFTINFDQVLSATVNILSLEGRLVQAVPVNSKKIQVNLSGEVPGIYLIEVISPEGTVQKKLIKQ